MISLKSKLQEIFDRLGDHHIDADLYDKLQDCIDIASDTILEPPVDSVILYDNIAWQRAGSGNWYSVENEPSRVWSDFKDQSLIEVIYVHTDNK